VAAPALAGIPVTHRGVASAFLVVSGHDEALFTRTISELSPEGVTLVILMGFGRRVELARVLLARGWRTDLPAALVADASRPDQHVWRGTLGEIAAGHARVHGDGPATMVIGEVAALTLGAAEGGGRRTADADPAGHPDDVSREHMARCAKEGTG
jgi:siroheme synthase